MKTLTIEEYKKRITTLEAQREKFEASMREFDRVKGDITLGIGAGNLTEEVLDKTGRELICEDAVIQELLSVRGIDYQNMVNCKLKNYTLLEWTDCIKEGILIEYAVPMLSRLLAIHPLASGIHYEGELLFYIVRAFQVGIATQADWLQYFKELVTGIIKTETEETLKGQLIPGILKPILLFGGAVEMYDKVTLDLIGFSNQNFWRFFSGLLIHWLSMKKKILQAVISLMRKRRLIWSGRISLPGITTGYWRNLTGIWNSLPIWKCL